MRGGSSVGFCGARRSTGRPRAIFNSGLAPVRSSSSAFAPAAADFLLTLFHHFFHRLRCHHRDPRPSGRPGRSRSGEPDSRALRPGCIPSHPGSRESGPKPERCHGGPDPVCGASEAMHAANSAKYPKTRRLWHRTDAVKITAARASINAKVRARRDLASSLEAPCCADHDTDHRHSRGCDPGARLARQGSGLVSSPRSRRSTVRVQRNPPEDQRGLHCSNRFARVNVG